MSKKKILIVMGGPLFPKTMASQDRVYKMIKRLSMDHTVDVATFIRDNHEKEVSQQNLNDVCRNFYPIPAINPKGSFFKRGFHRVKYLFLYYLAGASRYYYYYGNKKSINKIVDIINTNTYDIVQIEFCTLFNIFKKIETNCIKVIDTHVLLLEARERSLKNKYGDNIPFFQRRELKKYGELEKEALQLADVIISISKDDYVSLKQMFPHKKNIIIFTGQDIDYFIGYKTNPGKHTILFYGNMGTSFNIKAFSRFKDSILPLIKNEIVDVKVLVVGANPPDSIKKSDNGKDMIVTGFVDDVREYLSKATLMVLPLDIGAGFRSRVVDVMSMGIPVIGTHLALDSIEMAHGTHGYVTDSNEEMAGYAITLLNDPGSRKKMAEECKTFVSGKYSIEATYGILSQYYSSIVKENEKLRNCET